MVQTRLHKNVVLSDEDDCDAPLPTRPPPRGARGRQNGATNLSTERKVLASKSNQPSTQSKLVTDRDKSNSKRPQSKPFAAFFSAASRWPSTSEISVVDRAEPVEEESNDIIEDDFAQEISAKRRRYVTIAAKNDPVRKRSWSVADHEQKYKEERPTSQKFLKVQHQSIPSDAPTPQNLENISDPGTWNDLYAPKSLDELAVHHKKVTDVRTWLECVLGGKLHQRLLVLKGPAGSGKSTTVSMLSDLIGFTVSEWHNPEPTDVNSIDFISQSSQFADFLSRIGQFHRLDIVSSGSAKPLRDDVSYSGKRAVLIEEFPNVNGSSSVALLSFRSQILQYLASSTQPEMSPEASPTPLIIIISESTLSSSHSSEILTAHRLLGRDILHHPATATIEFNPIAPTFISKALKLVVQKHTRSTGRAQPISPSVIHRLAEIGDVRNAVSTLEYLSMNVATANASALSGRTRPIPRSSQKPKAPLDNVREQPHSADRAALALVSLRAHTLGLFHAIGKVIYNKRSETTIVGTASTQQPPPPHHLDPADLLSTAGASASTFISALHENYILSCFNPHNPSDMDGALANVEGCLDALGDADVLGNSRSGYPEGSPNPNTSNEGLRQVEIAFHVGVRAMQEALPYPVRRQGPDSTQTKVPAKYKHDIHRMFYPTDIKLWGKREEAKESLDYLVQQALTGHFVVDRSSFPRSAPAQGSLKDFPSWPVSQPSRVSRETTKKLWSALPERSSDDSRHDGGAALTSTLASGRSARLTLLLEHLPFYVTIAKALAAGNADQSASTRLMYEAEKLVEYKGTGILREEESDEEESQLFASRKDRHQGAQRDVAFSNSGFRVATNTTNGSGGDQAAEKLILSDDDIVDD